MKAEKFLEISYVIPSIKAARSSLVGRLHRGSRTKAAAAHKRFVALAMDAEHLPSGARCCLD